MAYTLNRYFQMAFSNPTAPHVIVYPNNTIAAQLLNYLKDRRTTVIQVSDCLSSDDAYLPMPNTLMRTVDTKVHAQHGRSIVIGLDGYLALLSPNEIRTFMAELHTRLDCDALNTDYLLSAHNAPNFEPRYTESRRIIFIEGPEEELEPLYIQAYSDKWTAPSHITGYKKLLEQMGPYEPSGNYTLIVKNLCYKQPGTGNTILYVLNIRDVAARYYGIEAPLDNNTLELLLLKLSENGQSAEEYLNNVFGIDHINIRLALKRLLELPSDDLWTAHLWLLRQKLPPHSYIATVLSTDVNRDSLLRKYIVDSTIAVLSDINAKKYARERAEAIKAIGLNCESLIIEFIGQTKENIDALQFLNCGTFAERIEIVRRASTEDLSYGLPKQYRELFPTLADYFSTDFNYGNGATESYFKEYRILKVSNRITDNFVKLAYNFFIPPIYRMRDAVLSELVMQSDAALLVVDAMGAEYMPLLLALAKRYGMTVESQSVVTVNLPTKTEFNPIKWDEARLLPEIKCVDNIVHDGAERHESCTPEQNFAETLWKFETELMNRIADGLTQFSRVIVTADHGASRLAVIAHNENKGTTLPWDGQPEDWRYSLAPPNTTRPSELEQAYFPYTKKTYWIVRGYNRLPKKGGKLYELHGGATPEEQFVPIVIFTRNVTEKVPKESGNKLAKELVDEFEGLI